MNVFQTTEASDSSPSLPRLLYIGDVPVQATYHGSALLYRLLKSYPSSRLLIVETSFERSSPERRLAGVRYETLRLRGGRLRFTRLHVWASSWWALRAGASARRIPPMFRGFEPEAVLTVTHGYAWLTAAAFAKTRRLPLHLILHDDWPRVAWLRKSLEGWKQRRFGEVYRQATSRLCVSPYMAEEYERRYGAAGSILYPARSEGTQSYPGPPSAHPGRPFTVGYAGTLSTTDYVRQLLVLARALRRRGGRVIVFGPPLPAAMLSGSDCGNIVFGGSLSWNELIQRLRAEVDVLILPSSFNPHDEELMAVNFPSKLADYTATGLPVLVWGAASSSAAKWAAMEPNAAALLTDPDEGAIDAMLERLIASPAWRSELGAAAAAAGERYFSPARADQVFKSCLSTSHRQTKA